ncbi:hypothetical protein M2167_007525 [Streptomyces sp. SPB4]|nr:hypothetical protein [Streptomyces sp. SPB4]
MEVPDRAKAMVETLDRLSQAGGVLSFDRPKRTYGFPSGQHVNMDLDLWMNRHRFKLSPVADRLFTFLVGTHDEEGQVQGTQTELAVELECSQGAVSKAIKQLDGKNLAWRVPSVKRRVQLNPLAGYRFRSDKHLDLLYRMRDQLKDRKIDIPKPGRRTS